MSEFPPVFTQLDISANSVTPGATAPDPQSRHLLAESIALQQRQVELLDRQIQLLTELVAQVSMQQRQRAAELKAWREANPELAQSCRKAAESLAAQVTEQDLAVNLIYPPMANIREASVEVAAQVAELIFDRGLARVPRPADVGEFVRSKVYDPAYEGEPVLAGSRRQPARGAEGLHPPSFREFRVLR